MAAGPQSTEIRHLRTLFSVGATGGLTDGQLLRLFTSLGGEPSELAFAALVDRHGPMVLRVARLAMVDEHSAHDAFQATFLILARKARSLWVRDSLGPWLHAVAHRVASQARSAEARRKRVEVRAASMESVEPRDDDRSDLARAIHQEIERLPVAYRVAVETCHLEGLTQHEAAARLGWPVGTLQSRLARGRQKLRDRLQRRGLAPSLAPIAAKIAPISNTLTTSTAKAAATLSLGGTPIGMTTPAVLAMIETVTKGMLMTRLKLGVATLVMLGGLVGSGMGWGFGRSARTASSFPILLASQITQPDESKPGVDSTGPGAAKAPKSFPMPDREPALTTPWIAQPWETVVRIKVINNSRITGQHSGTVIHSTADQSIILTTAHDFDSVEFIKSQPQSQIIVDLFDGKLRGLDPAEVSLLKGESHFPAEFVDIDAKQDLALIRIKPGWILPASRVVGPDFDPARGTRMISLGCSLGNNATAWDTTVLDKVETVEGRDVTQRGLPQYVCEHRPKTGRSGGGLFTLEGRLAGVSTSSYPGDAGLYAGPRGIISILDRNGLDGSHDKPAPPSDAEPLLEASGPILAPNPETPVVVAPSPTVDAPPKGRVPVAQDLGEPPLVAAIAPRPWATVVRVKLHLSESEWGFGSGTVITSTPDETIILTGGHLFTLKDRPQPLPKDFKIPISVDLFGDQFVRQQPARLGCVSQDLPAQVIDYDLIHDVGLIRIHPGRKLPASPVVPAGWKPVTGMTMTSLGCSHGQDATAWSTTILEPRVEVINRTSMKVFARMKCAHQPMEGRGGGGLYTSDGSVAGVCGFASPDEKAGLYAGPVAIHHLLDRNGLAKLYNSPAYDSRGETLGGDAGGQKRDIPGSEDVDLHGFKYPAPAIPRAQGTDPAEGPTIPTPPTHPIPDQGRRLDDLERKLDQVLKALEALTPAKVVVPPPNGPMSPP